MPILSDGDLKQIACDTDHALWSLLGPRTYQSQVASGNCDGLVSEAIAAAAELDFTITRRDAGLGSTSALIIAASDYREALVNVAARAHTLAAVEQACDEQAGPRALVERERERMPVPRRGSHLRVIGGKANG